MPRFVRYFYEIVLFGRLIEANSLLRCYAVDVNLPISFEYNIMCIVCYLDLLLNVASHYAAWCVVMYYCIMNMQRNIRHIPEVNLHYMRLVKRKL